MSGYYSYLLRVWQAGSPEIPVWRASLEDPHDHHLTAFANLEALFDYLRRLDETSPAQLQAPRAPKDARPPSEPRQTRS